MLWLRSNAREEQGKESQRNTGAVVWLRLDTEIFHKKIDGTI